MRDDAADSAGLAGLVLAAGAGNRMGRPKALIVGDDGVPWVARAAEYLRAGGASPVLVALGAAAEQAGGLVPAWSRALVIASWREGVGATLREALTALPDLTDATAVLLTLVDLPWAQVEAARRVTGAGWSEHDLRRATFAGRPGHPVLIGRAHWQPLVAHLSGDTGAQRYLETHGVVGVDCTDIGGGDDVDQLPRT